MRISTIALALCLAPVVPAAAQDSQASAPEKKTCRYYTTTGSILPPRRLCHTEKEWRGIDAQNRENTERTIDPTRDGYQRIGPHSATGG